MNPVLPSDEHAEIVADVVRFFSASDGVDAVLLVNSVARGHGTPSSDIDVAVLASGLAPDRGRALEDRWGEHASGVASIGRFLVDPLHAVHIDVFDGSFVPPVWDDGGGPDGFELEIGNRLVFGVPLWRSGDALDRLKGEWLPYYADDLRADRLAMVVRECRRDIDHIAPFVERALHFAAFDRLYKAFQEFLQALFIARSTYPLAYNKWIRYQLVELLGLPDLYRELPPLLEVARLESLDVVAKGETLRGLVASHCC